MMDVANLLVDRLEELIEMDVTITKEVLNDQFVIAKVLCGNLPNEETNQGLREILGE